MWMGIIPTFIALFALLALKDQYPANIWLLAAFTFFESTTIGIVCAIYQEIGYGDIILEAFAITTLVFAGLTAFACQTKYDFTIYHGLLGTLLMSLVVWSFIGMLFGFSMGAFYSWCGVLVFSGYIVVDTQMIMDKLGYDDYIIATIELYLDIINLFLYILRILVASRRSD
mmetsp:Transcript_39185/g.90273  ORF Transcript_39185/g.90273 Transcript_39185/m.90273 type:complete len:171 (-) Transcript_39185:139-651(-)